MSSHYLWQGEDLLLRCHLQPNAATNEIVGVHGDRLKLRITALPIDGKANEHIIRWLSKQFAVSKSHVEILQGDIGRLKTLRIRSPQVLPDTIQVQRQV